MKTLLAVDGRIIPMRPFGLQYLARAEQLTLLHALDVPRPAYPMMPPEVAEELNRLLSRACGKTANGCSIGFSPPPDPCRPLDETASSRVSGKNNPVDGRNRKPISS